MTTTKNIPPVESPEVKKLREMHTALMKKMGFEGMEVYFSPNIGPGGNWCHVYDSPWSKSIRPATADEIAAFNGLNALLRIFRVTS